MAKIKATRTPRKNQTQLESARPKLHIGHLLEAMAFGPCSEFPELSQSEIESLVFADPVEKRLYGMFSEIVQENFADVL